MPGQEKMCLLYNMKGNTFYPRQEKMCTIPKHQVTGNELVSLAILLAGRPIFRKGLMSHEDKSRENIPSVKCYYMYTISQYIKSRNDLELQYSPISISSFTCPKLTIIGCNSLQNIHCFNFLIEKPVT